MSYDYFENRDCPYYPCHKMENLNCLFCFCPLYHLVDCPGSSTATSKGIKDCSNCTFPHERGNYNTIIRALSCKA